MLYPLVPIFVTAVLGAPAYTVGVIEGVAEGTASFLKLASGWFSDRLGRRREIVIAGYALSGAAKPLLAVAGSWGTVLLARFIDRFGKGVRTSARDALIADSSPDDTRGRAFGFHRTADTAGAVAGPLLAIPLLAATHQQLRALFLFSVIPAAFGIAAVCLVRDRPPRPRPAAIALPSLGDLGTPLRRYILALLVFALGNSSDAFIILRGRQLGLSLAGVILAYAAYNAVYSLVALPAGIVSDRLGRRRIVIGGLAFFAAVYLGFALARAAWEFWVLLPIYGVYIGMADGATRAYAADLAAPERRGTVMGWLHMVNGIGAFVAGVVAGALWTWIGPGAAFGYGSLAAAAAAFMLMVWSPGDLPSAGPAA
jgi:MFS family permease